MAKTADVYWRWAAGGACLVSVCLVGCIPFVPIFYVYPSIAHTPSAELKAPVNEVVAFRVDSQEMRSKPGSGCPHPLVWTLSKLPPEQIVSSQECVGIGRGWFWYLIVGGFGQQTYPTVLVRLYRPGYHTIEIAPSSSETYLDWKTAATPVDREASIDALVVSEEDKILESPHGVNVIRTRKEDPLQDVSFKTLSPGSTSTEHLEALLFIAGEYEKLGSDSQADSQFRERVSQKAKNLRILAGK